MRSGEGGINNGNPLPGRTSIHILVGMHIIYTFAILASILAYFSKHFVGVQYCSVRLCVYTMVTSRFRSGI